MTTARRDLALLCFAGLLISLCLVRPTLPLNRQVFHYLFVLDITQSMNTQDYHVNQLPADRLSFGKAALRRAIRELPCGSTTAIAVFSTKDVLLLMQPLEICAHFSALDDTIEHIDWRMAWSADSNIERGLYGAILAAQNLPNDARLVFMSDGEQNIRELHRPPLARHAATVKGFLVGVGTPIPSPIPKLDQDNRTIGYWTVAEVDDFAIGSRELESAAQGSPDSERAYRSTLHEANLQILAAMSGLTYQRLETPKQFSAFLQDPDLGELQSVETDIRRVVALCSAMLIVAVFFPAPKIIRKSQYKPD
ncbi:MAG: vWA domain-containing protein [Gammaproteobacteria bacterium]